MDGWHKVDRLQTTQLPVLPAPWQLTGTGYVMAVRLPERQLDQDCFLDESLRASRLGKIAYVMFVDYQTADCGPYRELLFIPGSCLFSGKRCLTISKIYVSSLSSVVNGARNWGIPKEHCEFDVRYGADGIDRVRAIKHGKVFADLHFTNSGMRLPVHTSLAPARFRTLGQQRNGLTFIYTPRASGHLRRAALLSAEVDPAHFPDFTRGKHLLTCRISDFCMQFPPAAIQPLDLEGDLE